VLLSIAWAIAESGYTVPEVADAAHVDIDDLNAWLKGKPVRA
jgi:hypothetical protein